MPPFPFWICPDNDTVLMGNSACCAVHGAKEVRTLDIGDVHCAACLQSPGGALCPSAPHQGLQEHRFPHQNLCGEQSFQPGWQVCDRHVLHLLSDHLNMTFGSIVSVLVRHTLKYYSLSQCTSQAQGPLPHMQWPLAMVEMAGGNG